jgi:peptidoglycan hydrolase-like protein with peptidoglycan-binding domain
VSVAAPARPPTMTATVLSLQRQAGNAAVSALLTRRPPSHHAVLHRCGGPEPCGCGCSADHDEEDEQHHADAARLLRSAVTARSSRPTAPFRLLQRAYHEEGAPGARPNLEVGDQGPAVELLQRMLGVFPVDGIFGPQTQGAVKAFQNGTPGLGPATTGGVGPRTWAALDARPAPKMPTGPLEGTPGHRPNLTEGSRGPAVRLLQRRLDIINDGIFGPKTKQAVMDFQNARSALRPATTGGVGPGTWAALDSDPDNCLLAFDVIVDPARTAATPGPGGRTQIFGRHRIKARFHRRCDCSRFQYRQFIAGSATVTRGGAVRNLASLFTRIPGGLPVVMTEDAMIGCAGPNYGHREQPPTSATTATCPENHYVTGGSGRDDQADGCIYRGEDVPKLTVNGTQTGDIVDVLIQYRAEIQRDGAAVATRDFDGVNVTVVTP